MRHKEDEHTEWKEQLTDRVVREVAAFANSEGGTLYIGVSDEGRVVGLADCDGDALRVQNMIRDSIKPDLSLFCRVRECEENGREYLTVQVQPGSQRPYYLAGKGMRPEGVYLRQGSATVPASDTVIRQMLKETDGDRYELGRSFEQDLSFTQARREFARRELPLGENEMRTLGLVSRDGVYTNLALLLSDQCVHTIKAAAFGGADQSVFLDRKTFSGSLLQQMNQVYDWLELHNQNRAQFEGLLRIDRRDYPESAVREALLNAIVHREYGFSGSTLVSVYADRIEFVSVGGIVRGLSLDDVLLGVSQSRNERLAAVFYRLQLIEAYGTGMRKILTAYQGERCQPRFQTTENAFKVILPNRNAVPAAPSAAPAARASDEAADVLLPLAARPQGLTRKEAEAALGVTQTAAGRQLRRLEEAGRLRRKGRGRSTTYFST